MTKHRKARIIAKIKRWGKFKRKTLKSMKKEEKKYCKNDVRNIIALYNRKE